MRHARYLVAPVAALALVSGVSGVSQPAQAAPAAIKDCTKPKDLGNKTAVILVHGLFSKGDSWKGGGDASMYATLKKMPGVYVETFDYKDTNTAWVTSDNIGPRLSRRIACLAAYSREDKGLGKVVGIGHSMGGRALEFASNETVNNRKTSEDLAQIVTIGTPYQGSLGGNGMEAALYAMCNPAAPVGKVVKAVTKRGPCSNEDGFTAFSGLGKYSEEGKQLPDFPENLPVQAIAGDVTLQSQMVKTPFDWHTNSDLVVGVGSAFDNETYKQKGILVKCHEHIITRPDCWHSALTSNEKVKQAVVSTVSKYVTKTLSASNLNLKVPPSWATGKVMIDESSNSITGVRTSGTCYQSGYGSCDGFEIRGPEALHQGAGPGYFFDGTSNWSFSGGPEPCPGKSTGKANSTGSRKLKSSTMTVGGARAEYTEWQVGCADPSGDNQSSYTQRTWWIPSHQVAIVDYSQTSGLWDILHSASWSGNPATFAEVGGTWRALNISASLAGSKGFLSWDEPGHTATHIVDFTLSREGSQIYGTVLNGDSGPNDGYGDLSFETGEKRPIQLMPNSPGGVAEGSISIGEGENQIILCSAKKDPQGCGGS